MSGWCPRPSPHNFLLAICRGHHKLQHTAANYSMLFVLGTHVRAHTWGKEIQLRGGCWKMVCWQRVWTRVVGGVCYSMRCMFWGVSGARLQKLVLLCRCVNWRPLGRFWCLHWCSLVFSGVSIRCRSEVDGRTLTVEKGRRTERDRDGGGAPPKGPRETFQNRVCYVLQICAGTPNTTQKNGWGKLSGSRTGLDAARASVYIYVAASASTLEQGRNAAALTLEQENSFFNTPGIDMCT